MKPAKLFLLLYALAHIAGGLLLSWQQGIYLNALINGASLFSLLVPLWRVRHNFLQTPNSASS